MFSSKQQYLAFRAAWSKASQAGQLQSGHYVMYNILRNRAANSGFTPTSRRTKLLNGHMVNGGFGTAMRNLRDAQGHLSFRDLFLAPFGDVIPTELLQSLKTHAVEPIDPTWGYGAAVKDYILQSDVTPTLDEIDDFINQAKAA